MADQGWLQILSHFFPGTSPLLSALRGVGDGGKQWYGGGSVTKNTEEVTLWQFPEPGPKTLTASNSCPLEYSRGETPAAMQSVPLS